MNVLGVDVGGTFTDAVLLADGDLRTAKVPTARRQEESVLAAARAVGADGVERFTHGTTVATHERAGAAELRRRLPGRRVVASHDVAPEFREYERASTTAIDAYLGPVVSRYLKALRAACGKAGLPEPLVMGSSGGVVALGE